MTLTLHKSQVHSYMVSFGDELVVHSCLLLCLQREVVKVARALFYCWSVLRNNTMATNLQRFTLCYDSSRFVASGSWLLNADILAGDATRLSAASCKPRTLILCEKKHE